MFVYAVAARVAVHLGKAQRVRDLLARAQPLRMRLTYAAPILAVQARLELARVHLAGADPDAAEVMCREIEAILRRRPEIGALADQATELRANLRRMRAYAPGARG